MGAGLLGLGKKPAAASDEKDDAEAESSDFESAAQDAFDAAKDGDADSFKLALRAAIEAVLGEEG